MYIVVNISKHNILQNSLCYLYFFLLVYDTPADGIEGIKLPLEKKILGYFLYHHTIQKEGWF